MDKKTNKTNYPGAYRWTPDQVREWMRGLDIIAAENRIDPDQAKYINVYTTNYQSLNNHE